MGYWVGLFGGKWDVTLYFISIFFLCRLHQKAYGNYEILQDMNEHSRSRQEYYTTMGGDVTVLTKNLMHLGKAIIEP